MLKNITIRNYKSIKKLELPLGRVNILIGENGAGKSNILEAIALAGAASANKLDNEFLVSRGIRVTSAELMRSAFKGFDDNDPIFVNVECESKAKIEFKITHNNEPYTKWQHAEKRTPSNDKADSISLQSYAKWQHDETSIPSKNGLSASDIKQWMKGELRSAVKEGSLSEVEEFLDILLAIIKLGKEQDLSEETIDKLIEDNKIDKKLLSNRVFEKFTADVDSINEIKPSLDHFVVYSPENSSLKKYTEEGQIEPLGINGEGLLKLIEVMGRHKSRPLNEIKKNLKLLNWFKDFEMLAENRSPELLITDRHLDKSRSSFDQNSANEGFLFLMFYFVLFESSHTPDFFAVDNIDASLNPKLCQKMMRIICETSKRTYKQSILTTHNAAILDGIDIFNDDERLFVIERNSKGHTECRRILPPEGITKEKWEEEYFGMKLSEIWLSGAIGGLPKGF